MAAETLATAGLSVDLYDAMPSVGRKFLLAGKGGLNLTHSEPLSTFIRRYGCQSARFSPWLAQFGPDEMRNWAAGLGIQTFVGSSGRVFPSEMKAAPLLRAWVRRLRELGVRLHPRHRWTGRTADGVLTFDTPCGPVHTRPNATILALGGASWPQLGSDGAWTSALASIGQPIAPLKPANMGFLINWSSHMAKYFGSPVKNIALTFQGQRLKGEIMLTDYGVEGGAIYALSAPLRDQVLQDGQAILMVDLKPDLNANAIEQQLRKPRERLSQSNVLRKALHLTPAAIALLRETATPDTWADLTALSHVVKAAPLRLNGVRSIGEAISTAGGVCFEGLDDSLMARNHPGLFFAGEMLDWEAPTGGYLLTACLASGKVAGKAALTWLKKQK